MKECACPLTASGQQVSNMIIYSHNDEMLHITAHTCKAVIRAHASINANIAGGQYEGLL